MQKHGKNNEDMIKVLSILVFFSTGEILALKSNPCPWKVFALVLCEDPPTPLVAWTVHRPSSTPNNRRVKIIEKLTATINGKQQGKTRSTTQKTIPFFVESP